MLVPMRPLKVGDIPLLASEGRGADPRPLQAIRDRHHALARVLSTGVTQSEASAITGFTPGRISILLQDPSFKDLLEGYRKHENHHLAEFTERVANLELSAVNRLQEIVEDEEAPPSATTTLEIAKFAADRNGHAPVAKSINLNANVGLGDRMNKARQRLKALMAPDDEARRDSPAGPNDAFLDSIDVEFEDG